MGRVGGRIAHLWARVTMSGVVEGKVKDPTALVMGIAGQGTPLAGLWEHMEEPGNPDSDRGSIFPTWSRRGSSLAGSLGLLPNLEPRGGSLA